MSEIRVPIDPLNPGQFFACCGLFEMLPKGQAQALARFEVSESAPRKGHFVVENAGGELGSLLTVLREAQSEGVQLDGDVEGAEGAVQPVRVWTAQEQWLLNWWLDEFQDKTVPWMKCWAGQVRSAGLVSELLSLLEPSTPAVSLFTGATMSKAKFGIDPRSAWNALDFGFSPNAHNKDAATYAAVEVLGCFGLQTFRPFLRASIVRYNLWTDGLPLRVARLAAFRPWPGLRRFQYEFSVDKRGSYKYFGFASFKGRED